ncbi:MAG: PEP-CTERM sorting domain-containing protein [Phycisphaerae bacterium]|nr:PEP-CTERM sorting domain-containing protein [Phycisphaerae bacterium]
MSSTTRLAAVVLLWISQMCLGDASVQALDFPAYGVSADGRVPIGVGRGPVPSPAYQWSEVGGTTLLGAIPDGHSTFAWGASANGSVIAGSGSTDGFRWTASQGFETYTSQLGQPFWAYGVTGDGTTVVGRTLVGGLEVAATVSAAGSLSVLGDLPGGRTEAKARGVSMDGGVIVGYGVSEDAEALGFSGYEAFRWTSEQGMIGLGSLPGDRYDTVANAVSADGTVVVGLGTAADGAQEAFRWTADEGMTGLGRLSAVAWAASRANDVSLDGSVIVGSSTSDGYPGQEAFIWDAEHGMRSLFDVLSEQYGLDLTGWQLNEARGISDDGLTIVGNGRAPDGTFGGWVVRVPEPATLLFVGVGTAFLSRRRLNVA